MRLRDKILTFVAQDMRRPQSDAEQEAKSRGLQPRTEGQDDTAAELHAAGRLLEGFDLPEMVSEYRALRASVIRLWSRDMGSADRDALNELVRFNEAIDQALIESIARLHLRLEHSRELVLGVLGHDLRTPLGGCTSRARSRAHGGTIDIASSEEGGTTFTVCLRRSG